MRLFLIAEDAGAVGPVLAALPRGGAAVQLRAPGVAAGKVTVAKSKVTVRYALTAAATITLSVAPANRHATVVAHAHAPAGVKNQITWKRKLHGKTAKPGKYKLTITATADGLSSHSTLTIRL